MLFSYWSASLFG